MAKIGDLVTTNKAICLFVDEYGAAWEHYGHALWADPPFLVLARKTIKTYSGRKVRVVRLLSVALKKEFWTRDTNLLLLSRGR